MIIILSVVIAIITIIAIWQTRYIYTLKYKLKQANKAAQDTPEYKELEKKYNHLSERKFLLIGDYLELKDRYDTAIKELRHAIGEANKSKFGNKHGLK